MHPARDSCLRIQQLALVLGFWTRQASSPTCVVIYRRGAAIAMTASGDAEDCGIDDDDGGDDTEQPEQLDPCALAKQAKVASLWQQINARAAANGSATQRPPSAAVNLAALCRSNLGAKKPKRSDQDAVGRRVASLRALLYALRQEHFGCCTNPKPFVVSVLWILCRFLCD